MNFFRRLLARFKRWREVRRLRRYRENLQRQPEPRYVQSMKREEWLRLGGLMAFEGNECRGMVAGPQPTALREASFMDPFLSQDVNFALEQTQWARLTNFAKLEYSRWGLTRIILLCRYYFMSDPLIRRAINLSCSYVFGRGIQMHSDHGPTNDAIEAFVAANPDTMSPLGMVRSERRIQYDGNLFFVFFWDEAKAQMILRKLDPLEISDIITDPEDVSCPWYYKRIWSAEVLNVENGSVGTVTKTCWYPALEFEKPANAPQVIGNNPVMWETPVLHVKEGEIDGWKFGVPPVYPAVPWARLYKEFLENWASIVRAFQSIAWNVTTEGGQQAIQNLDTALKTTIGDGGFQPEYNPPPVVGSVLTTGKGTTLAPVKTSGYATSLEEGQRLGLQVGVALDLPETILFGRADVGNLATSQTLDRPTEMKYEGRQKMWAQVYEKILRFVLTRTAKAPKSLLAAQRDAKPADMKLVISFPSILEHDPLTTIQGIVAAGTNNGYALSGEIDPKTLALMKLNALGIADAEHIVEAIFPADYDPADFAPDPNPPAPDPTKLALPQLQKKVAEALRLINEALGRAA